MTVTWVLKKESEIIVNIIIEERTYIQKTFKKRRENKVEGRTLQVRWNVRTSERCGCGAACGVGVLREDGGSPERHAPLVHGHFAQFPVKNEDK
jgi:hypothetical protein